MSRRGPPRWLVAWNAVYFGVIMIAALSAILRPKSEATVLLFVLAACVGVFFSPFAANADYLKRRLDDPPDRT